MERVAKLPSTRPTVQALRECRESVIRRAGERLVAVGAPAQVDLTQQLRALLEHNPLAYGLTSERGGRGITPLVGLGAAALLTPIMGSQHWFIGAGMAVGAGLLSSAVAAWRSMRQRAAVWMLEFDRLTIHPPDSESWQVPLSVLTHVEIAANRREIHLYRTPALRGRVGTPVVPLQTTAVRRVAGLIELYRSKEWQTRPRTSEGDCALMTAALTPGLQGWAVVSKVGAAFVRDGAAEAATLALTGRRVLHLLGEQALLRELSRLPDVALLQLASLLGGVEGCAFLPATQVELMLTPRVHLVSGGVALTVGASAEDTARLERWFGGPKAAERD